MRMPRPLTLFLLTIALVVLGTGLRFGLPIYREQVAIREIRRLGGDVWVTGPDWAHRWFGRKRTFDLGLDVLGEPDRVFLEFCATDEALRWLQHLPRVKEVHIRCSGITDAGLVHLRGLPVSMLDAQSTPITDAGLQCLQDLPMLRFLNVGGTRITKPAVARLRAARPEVSVQDVIQPFD
jgi:hypothetical protein